MMNQNTIRCLMVLLGISALGLMACTTTSSNKTQASKLQVVYQCERGTILNVSFIERGYTTLQGGKHYKRRYHEKTPFAIVNFGNNQEVTLMQEVTASGYKYSDGRYALHSKGDEAIWMVGKMADERCVLND